MKKNRFLILAFTAAIASTLIIQPPASASPKKYTGKMSVDEWTSKSGKQVLEVKAEFAARGSDEKRHEYTFWGRGESGKETQIPTPWENDNMTFELREPKDDDFKSKGGTFEFKSQKGEICGEFSADSEKGMKNIKITGDCDWVGTGRGSGAWNKDHSKIEKG